MTGVFHISKNKNLVLNKINNNLIETFKVIDRLLCISKAKKIGIPMAIYENQMCRLYIKPYGDESDLVESFNSFIYLNQDYFSLITDLNHDLIHYWPLNNNLNDIVSNYNLIGGLNYNYILDRFNERFSAVYLNNGYLQAPSGVYFFGNFTVSVWVNPISTVGVYDRIIDFGKNSIGDNILISLSLGTPFKPYILIYDGTKGANYESSISLETNKWQHVVLTLKETNAKLYINGNLAINVTTSRSNAVLRTTNFIGKSNWKDNSQSVNCQFDDLKIFNRSLNIDEIMFIFKH